MNRKSFLNTLARGGILALMALIAGVFYSRRQVSLERDCGLDLQCRNCSRLNDCGLPRAEKERENEKG